MPGNGVGKKSAQIWNRLLKELRPCRRMIWTTMPHVTSLVGFIRLGTIPRS